MGGQSTRDRGRAFERVAIEHLDRAGMSVIATNVTAAGAELDIIARDGSTVVFVEVRSRANDRRGHPFETIDRQKRTRIRRAATAWLVRANLWNRVPVRFDVIGIVGTNIDWLQDAF